MNKPSAYERKKDPDKVQRALLDAAAKMVAEHGLTSLTVDAVASAAGVTKGGLFHHFPSKSALIRHMFNDLLEHFDRLIDAHLANDPQPYARFTRAYVEGVFSDHDQGGGAPSSSMSVSLLEDPDLQRAWSDWLGRRLESHADTDGDARCEVVRLAADGVWLTTITPGARFPVDFQRARETLLSMIASPGQRP